MHGMEVVVLAYNLGLLVVCDLCWKLISSFNNMSSVVVVFCFLCCLTKLCDHRM